MSNVISLAAFKGGSGKSAGILGIAGALAEQDRRRRILVLDFDPQGSVSKALGITPEILEDDAQWVTIRDVLLDDVPLEDAAWVVAPGIELVAADLLLTDLAVDFAERQPGKGLLRSLQRAIQAAPPDRWSHILIDTPPSVAEFSQLALAASDGVIIPTWVEQSALDQVPETLAHIASIQGEGADRPLNPDLRILGILPQLTMPRTKLHQKLWDDLDALAVEAGVPVLPDIRHQIAVQESIVAHQPIVSYAPFSQAANAYRQIAAILTGAPAILMTKEPTHA